MKKPHTVIVDSDKITFPDSTEQTTKAVRSATLVVAANDSSVKSKAQADYVCNGTNDHVEIQAALDALPATGGEVLLLEGTYYVEASLVLDSYQTLRGCGRNTILTTTTASLHFITATGSDGSEKIGIFIADLCIDGAAIAEVGLYWVYVDYSKIRDIWVRDVPGWTAIYFENCDFNEMLDNIIRNSCYGFDVEASCNNIIAGNSISGGDYEGIYLGLSSNNNTISGNACIRNYSYGIQLHASYNNIISGNTCQRNGRHGICLTGSSNNIISGNICLENGQAIDNTYDNIYLTRYATSGHYNLIQGNLCRAPTIGTTLTVGEPIGETEIAVTDTAGFEVGMGVVIDLGGGNEEYHRISAITASAPGVITIDTVLVNAQGAGETIDMPEAKYGINIDDAVCEGNLVIDNDLYDSGKTAPFNDDGTLTEVRDNRGTEIYDNKIYQKMKNTSGGALAAGDVVVFKTGVAAGNEVTTTVVKGDDYIYGMAAEVIADNAVGLIQIGGKTTALKVDGTDDIAIGDFICAFTTAKIGCKAGAGDMAFAIALEAYATDNSNGVIDALIMSTKRI